MSYVGNKPAQATIPADDAVTTAMLKDDAVTSAKIAGTTIVNADVNASAGIALSKLASDPTYDDAGIQDDIAILGFKVASNGSLAKYDLVDQTIDDFQDTSGVNAGTSTGETRDSSGKYYSGVVTGNYYGDSSDGSLTTSGNVTHTVPNKVGSYDGDMVIKEYSALTISAGDTMTVDQGNRGMFIYVAGDCVINGTLSMTALGGNSNPTTSGGSDGNSVGASGLQIGLKTSGGTQSFTNNGTGFNGAGTAVRTAIANAADISSNGTIFSILQTNSSSVNGTTGAAAISTAQGGQGAGGSGGTPGRRGYGGAFSAGGGAGQVYCASPATCSSGAGGDYGAAGGAGGGTSATGGGAGNPGGAGANGGGTGGTGVGGIILLIVKGDLTIGASGSIQAQGVTGGTPNGGSSGGGAIHLMHGGTFTNNGSISVAPGSALAYSTAAGTGGTNTAQISVDSYTNMTLVSTTTTAQAAPTKGDIVFTYTNGAGTTTLGTDVTAEYSADGGSTWTAMTLGSEGTTGGHNIATAHDVSLTSTSGTSMAYRIKTLNQSVSKTTRIQAVSLGWS
tara:strand:- start:523 stop:2208 length:1686 start_codon:yes stop_codon:yes gene_type:complete